MTAERAGGTGSGLAAATAILHSFVEQPCCDEIQAAFFGTGKFLDALEQFARNTNSERSVIRLLGGAGRARHRVDHTGTLLCSVFRHNMVLHSLAK